MSLKPYRVLLLISGDTGLLGQAAAHMRVNAIPRVGESVWVDLGGDPLPVESVWHDFDGGLAQIYLSGSDSDVEFYLANHGRPSKVWWNRDRSEQPQIFPPDWDD